VLKYKVWKLVCVLELNCVTGRCKRFGDMFIGLELRPQGKDEIP
jgi:hypothetical protein